MKFDDLETRMRVFETAHDHCVLPGLRIAIRLDGRGFTRLTKEQWNLQAPFDEIFRDAMLNTTEHLMQCGFNVVYGYTQSDEISLLLQEDDVTFARKLRKIISILAGEASAKFTNAAGHIACFDARVSQLPSDSAVVDYFRWRHEDAHRNSLSAHCYWLLRRQGADAEAATARLSGLSTAEKNEFLFQHGINFNDLPAWQKRGSGLYWEDFTKPSLNPKSGEMMMAKRRRLHRNLDLPQGDAYSDFVKALVRPSAT
jgi:tRNA(His) guanylyltransferase